MKNLLVGLALVNALTTAVALGHEGPPFEILNERAGPYQVSVWSDPDIGTGTFFVVLEPVAGAAFSEPDSVTVAVRPTSGRLPESVYKAEKQAVRYGSRHYAEVYFDRGELWGVRVTIAGGGIVRQVSTRVEATPDGTIGPVGLLLYLLPFLAVGFLWYKAYRRRRERRGR